MEYYLEQTTCPHCKNNVENIILLDDKDVLHRACGKCKKHYVVSRPIPMLVPAGNKFLILKYFQIGEHYPNDDMVVDMTDGKNQIDLQRFGLTGVLEIVELNPEEAYNRGWPRPIKKPVIDK